jgi:hypothetical protein
MPWERDQIRASLTSKGFKLDTDRDHDVLTLEAQGLNRAIWTKLSRGKKYKVYGDGLLAEICSQLGVTKKQLNRLVGCDMDGAEYLGILRDRGIIRA